MTSDSPLVAKQVERLTLLQCLNVNVNSILSFFPKVQSLLDDAGLPWFDTFSYAGSPVHIRAHGDQTRTLLDWWLFTRMDLIVATRSGYSESAAKYSCVPLAVNCVRSAAKNYPRGTKLCDKFEVFLQEGLCTQGEFDMQHYKCPK